MAVPMDSRTYLLLTLLTVVALAGLIAFFAADTSTSASTLQLTLDQRHALGLMALAVLLMFAAYGWYNMTFVQFQGRYLFPSLIPLAIFFSLGLIEALNGRWAWWLVGGLALALIWVIAGSGLTGSPDKWAVVMIGLSLVVAIGRIFVDRHSKMAASWLVALCFLGLIVLTLASPFWFVIPYL
jgi:hypothetical protein